MSDPEPTSSTTPQVLTGGAPAAVTGARPPDAGGAKVGRRQVAVHRLDGGLERGESDARALSVDGFFTALVAVREKGSVRTACQNRFL